jgi:hypothetical protein
MKSSHKKKCLALPSVRIAQFRGGFLLRSALSEKRAFLARFSKPSFLMTNAKSAIRTFGSPLWGASLGRTVSLPRIVPTRNFQFQARPFVCGVSRAAFSAPRRAAREMGNFLVAARRAVLLGGVLFLLWAGASVEAKVQPPKTPVTSAVPTVPAQPTPAVPTVPAQPALANPPQPANTPPPSAIIGSPTTAFPGGVPSSAIVGAPYTNLPGPTITSPPISVPGSNALPRPGQPAPVIPPTNIPPRTPGAPGTNMPPGRPLPATNLPTPMSTNGASGASPPYQTYYH